MTALESTTPTAVAATTHRIFLTGFMGAGKSTIGRLLADRLGWSFLDLDTHLEHRAGSTIPELFALHGEPHFRRLESSALASTLALQSTIIALGGGVPEIQANRLLLEQTPHTLTIFLDAPFPVLFDRCVLQAIARPNLRDPLAAQARFDKRLPIYRRLARITQQTEDNTPEQTVAALLRAIEDTSR